MKILSVLAVLALFSTQAIAQDEGSIVATAGGEVYSKSHVYADGGARLTAGTSWGKGIFKSDYPAGTALTSISTKAAFKACKSSNLEPCWLDDDGDGLFDRMASSPVGSAWKLDEPLPYERDAFKQVILYQGATADSLRFSYREFSVDMARPAFTEELVIPRELFPQMISIKGLQIEVLGVTGMGLQYRLVKTDLVPAQTLTGR